MKKYIILFIINLLLIGYSNSQVTVNGYEYWFDNAFSSKVSTNISPSTEYNLNTEFPTVGLANGLHTLNIRFKDSQGKYSSTLSQFFQKLPTNSTPTNHIKSYEYWVDNNFSNKISVPVSPSETYNLVDSINLSSISNGLHTIHFRFKDEQGLWSGVTSQFFQKLPTQSLASNKIVAYEYWTDNNYSNKVFSATANSQSINLVDSFSMASLSNGLHTYHIRFKDSRGQWSGVLSQFFQKLPAQNNVANTISAYEYWVDNNFAGKVSTSITPSQSFSLIDSLAMASISNGLHTIHFRFKDSRGQWSGVLSQFFQKLPNQNNTTNLLTAYEFWIDNNYENKINSPIVAGQSFSLIDSLNLASISNGLHTIHIRFKDSRGQWSVVASQFFQKLPNQNTNANNLTAYEYWIDNDYSNKVNQGITANQTFSLVDSLQLSSISNGLHTMHIRFKDTRGQWSGVISQFIQKMPSSEILNNKITAYRFWFDDSVQTMRYVHLPIAVASINVDTLLDISFIPKGSHEISFQFKDSIGLWSSAITDTVYKFATPIASFTQDKEQFCDSSLVNFTNTSFDVDTIISWKFGATDTTRTENPSYNFTTPGVYPIQLIAGDIETGIIDTVYSEVRIGATPTVNLGIDTAICHGTSIQLDAQNTGYSYSWNTISTQRTISVSDSGIYSVTVSDIYDCKDIDSIHIAINPLPIVNLGADTAICAGNAITFNAHNTGSSFNWSNGGSNQTTTVTSANTYSVTVTDNNLCSKADSIILVINALPIVNLGNDTAICAGNTITFNAQNTGKQFNWSNGGSNQTTTVSSSNTYIVTVTDNKDCAKADSIVLYVNSLPTVELGSNQAICQGGYTSLDAITGASYYYWSTGQTIPSITVNNAGKYFVTVTDANDCSNIDSVSVIVNPLPIVNLGADTAICQGSSITLNAGNPGSSYLWSTSATSQTQIVSSQGTIITTVTNSYGCHNSDTINITINPLPFIQLGNDTTINHGQTVDLDATISGSAIYNWNTGATTPTITVDSTGEYLVVVTQNSCSSVDSISVTVINSINEAFNIGNDNLKVYPVPFLDYIKVEWQANTDSKASLVLMNIEGKLIRAENIEVYKGKNAYELNDLSALSAGTYLLSIKQGNSVTMMKVVKRQE